MNIYTNKMTQFLRNLSTFSKKEIDTFLGSFDTVLVDGDGVLWFLENPLTTSIQAVNKLKELGKKVFLVSNNSTLTLDEFVEKVDTLKLNVDKDEIIIPSVLVAEYLREQKLEKNAFVLASSAFKKELESSGIKCSDKIGPDYAVEGAKSFQRELQNLDNNVGAVIVDFDFDINYVKLTKAMLHLSDPDCLFVAGAADLEIPVPGIRLIGPGWFISSLEHLTGRKAKIFGKPSPVIKECISKRHPINCERTLVIGDTLLSDMKLGTDCGFLKLLVLSGISKLEDTEKDSTNLPHYYLQTLGDLLPLLPSL